VFSKLYCYGDLIREGKALERPKLTLRLPMFLVTGGPVVKLKG